MNAHSLKAEFSVSDDCDESSIPETRLFEQWFDLTWQQIKLIFAAGRLPNPSININQVQTLSVFFCDETKMKELNGTYRNTPKPTNVLSFSAFESKDEALLPDLALDCLGDLVFCPSIIDKEAQIQYQTDVISHWAHLSVHGLLHLVGYDHQNIKQASQMEELEIAILKQLGFNNPYLAC